jgi:hypothetical protein
MKVKQRTVFWGNQRVSHEAIIEELRGETQGRMHGLKRVLLVQDTTSLDYSGHQATEGLGPLENKWMKGVFVHSTLSVSEGGLPLGVLGQQVWSRDAASLGKRAKRHETAFEDKESYKWVAGLEQARQEGHWTEAVTVCDREAHIYEFLAATLDRGLEYVVRASSQRSFTLDGEDVYTAIQFAPVSGHYALEVKRRPDREARLTTIQVRFGSLTLRRPKRATGERETITLQVIDAVEPQPPAAEKPIHWVLLTSLPVNDLPQAREVIRYYTYRWLIERFHYTLKSGCRIEASQLRTADRLDRLLAVYSAVAWHLLWLTYQARLTPDAPCTTVLTPSEWQALYAFIHHSARLPKAPPPLRQAARWIAQLGGFLGRKADGDPGVKVLWRGWSRLQDIVNTWSIFHPLQDVGNA